MTLASGDLTTLAAVKAYLGSPPSDAILSRLITAISGLVTATLNRSFLTPRSYTRQFDGTGTRALVIPEWPLLNLASLTISGTVIPIAPQATGTQSFNQPFGYRFQPWDGLPPGDPAIVELLGFNYMMGRQNV